jgi:hypothetical protein
MKNLYRAMSLLVLLSFSGLASAQTEVLYITNGDADDIWAIQGGVVIDSNLDVGGSRRYRVAVWDSVWLGDMDSGQNVELSLDLDPTGNSSLTGVDIVEGTDGATDGTYNYTVESFVSSGDVYRFDNDWSGGEALFTVTGNDIVGITYDADNGTLWISDRFNIYEYSMAGALLGQFPHEGGRGSLAYETTSDTLWYVSNGAVSLRQYSKTGTLLDTLSSGVGANVWGAEFVGNQGAVPDTARFKVTKAFSDGINDEVGVTLTCTTGLPLSQPATIAGGDEVGVTFVVTNLGDGANCEVTESGVPSGYTAILNDGDGCSWTEVQRGFFTCEIYNQAKPATFTVHKDWVVVNDGGDQVFGVAVVTATCNAEIVGGDFDIDTGYWSKSDGLGDGEMLVATVDTTEGSATCWASESVLESGVESEDDCGARQIAAGGSSSCTFTNTVFFEGIPTLSQYGLAIMALLMLGVGFVGFRRFV